MTNAQNESPYDWLFVVFLIILMYLFSLSPFLLKGGKFSSIFTILCVWAMAYERGLKLVWRKDNDKKMAVFVFFIPSAIGFFSFFYVLFR